MWEEEVFHIEIAFTLLSSSIPLPPPSLSEPTQNATTNSTTSPFSPFPPAERKLLKNYEHEFSALESLDENQLSLLNYKTFSHTTLFAGH
jgi:hypothetical protein